MIKFWKSAAKGKTGCPVRPPELNASLNFENILLENVLEVENDDSTDYFEKKSLLSPNLQDILVGKKGITHFVSYMESIGKDYIIKCWIELEKFQSEVMSEANNFTKTNKINSVKSLEDINTEKEFGTVSKPECLKSSCSNLSRTKNDIYTNNNGNTNLYSNSDTNQSTDLTDKAIILFKKYVALEAPIKLELRDAERKIVISNICQPEGKIMLDCFKPVQDALFNQMDVNHFGHFVNSSYYIKSQIDILTSGFISLKDILYNETILFYFTEYLEQESCSILLELLIAVTHFKDNLLNNSNVTPEQSQSDAIVLYDKYFSLQATSPVGFPTEVRLKVESDICNEKGPLATCFDVPYKIIFRTLSSYVKLFLESEIYYTYLSEMIKSVDQLWSATFKSHSDCSSEFSVSTQNTLLAMGDPLYKKKRNHSVPDMTIDSNQLYNADALWQRKKHDGLSLGRINSLGRFESKFEPDPDKNNKSVLKRMVSKLVPTTSNVKEELAWQVAHMIVKDITDLTMSAHDNDNDHV